MTTLQEQQRATENFLKWHSKLLELENGPRDAEWRFAAIAEQAWASAVVRSGLEWPVEHLKLRYVA